MDGKLINCRFDLHFTTKIVLFNSIHFNHFFQTLQKDVNNRLGCSDAGGEDLKKHIFFRNINWPQLEAGMFKPPFAPDVSFSFISILMKGILAPQK